VFDGRELEEELVLVGAIQTLLPVPSLLFEIAVGRRYAQPGAAPHISAFVSARIEEERSPAPTAVRSFADILQSLRENRFAILAGVDSAEVCAFVDSVESSEQGAKRE
jgi:hypothetical protein